MEPVISFSEIGQDNNASKPQTLLRFVHPNVILNTGSLSKERKSIFSERKQQVWLLSMVLFWAAVNCPYMEKPHMAVRSLIASYGLWMLL